MNDLSKDNIKNMYFLSPMQEGMLYHSLLDQNSHAYFEQTLMFIKGDLNAQLVEESFNRLIARYDIFRTVFVYKKVGRPVQVVMKERQAKVHFEDISHLPETDRKRFVEEFKMKDRDQGFDLSQDIPIRIAMIQTGNGLYSMIWSFHHIIMDGWCLGIIYRDFLTIYKALKANQPISLGKVYPYSNYIKWLENQDQTEGASYWEKYLEGYETNASLPSKKTMPLVGEYRQQKIFLTIPKRTMDGLENKIKAYHVTLNTIFQAIWGIILQKYNHTDDVAFGKVVSGRPHEIEGIEGMVGLFINALPVRVKGDGEKTFSELVHEIQHAELQSEKYSYSPLAEIQSKTGLKIDHLLVFENFPVEEAIGSGNATKNDFSVENVELFEQTNYDFGIAVIPGKNFTVRFTYNANVYESDFIGKLIESFQVVLETVATSPDVLIKNISILTKAEQEKILYDFNANQTEYPKGKTIQELFEKQVSQRPDQIAVAYGEQRLTYRELNAKANQLARVLRKKGVEAESIVGLMVERSVEMIVGIMAILKAGGAYLPIDPEYPESRIQYMLENSHTSILLTQESLLAKIKFSGELLNIQEPAIYKGSSANLKLINTPDNLAYTIYTSGTTGHPKGVMIEHKNVAALVTGLFQAIYESYPASQRVALIAPYVFDASVKQIFAALLLGHSLYIVPQEVRVDGKALKEYYRQYAIDISDGTPAHISMLTAALADTADDLKVKHFLIGGEALGINLIQDFYQRLKAAKPKITNVYGPTECCVDSATYLVNPEELNELNSIPIGKPLANWKLYVLGKSKEILPVGIAGELYIGGSGVGRGYLNNAELTAEKFIANPFIAGEKMYRTGDLVKWLPDGNIEFIGRIDEQVKVRGYRIELGEIESQLLKYEPVQAAVVVAREEGSGNKYLCAYIVAEQELNVSDLRKHLAKELPDYMIPSYFVPLEKIPLTSNGKVDRKALPEPDGHWVGGAEYTAPRNKKEEILAQVWQEVLKAERVGIKDNFFNLGGDSIKAIQVLSRMNGHGYKLELKDLFKYPMIEELSQFVTATNRDIDQGVITGETRLTPIQCRLFEQAFAGKNHYNQAVMLYRKEGFAEGALRKVFTKLVEHHDALRMVIRTAGEKISLVNRGLEGALYSLEVHDLTGAGDYETAIENAAQRIQKSIDLANGPLIKTGLFKTMDGDHLLIVIHHLVIDGVSWRILLEDIATGYQQVLHQETINFKAKTDSFLAWSNRLHAYADSKEFLREIEYWQQLESQNIKSLPKDHPVDKRWNKDVANVRMELTAAETEKLLKHVHKAYNTEINDILLSALGLAVREWSGATKVLVNLEGHGRETIFDDIDISRTVGWFTAQFPIVLDVGGDIPLPSRIKSIKENIRHIPGKGVGYGILKYLTSPANKKALTCNLNPEIGFNYLGQFDQDLDIGVFEASTIDAGQAVSGDFVRPHALDINGGVAGGRLGFSFTYNINEYQEATIMKLATSFREQLVALNHHCVMKSFTEFTPSDFTSKSLTFEDVEAVYHTLKEERENIKDLYFLAPMQEGMLYHSILDKSSRAYFEQADIAIRGKLDIQCLDRSFNRIIQRYDIFRTIFIHENVHRPLQVVLKNQKSKIYFEDICHLSGEAQESSIEEFKADDRKHGFDLTKDTLLRVAVMKTGDNSYRLIWSNHHIIMDGWCLGIVFKELFEIYDALKSGRLPNLEVAYPYSNYIQWLERQDNKEAATYWDEYLKDYQQQALVPKVKGTYENLAYEPAEHNFTITRTVKNDLEAIAKKNNTTLNNVIQAVWGILLQRYNNGTDVVFGAVISGRPSEVAGIEKMVGLFINAVPVRVKSGPDKLFSELLKELTQSAIGAEKYGYSPLAEIQSRTSLKQALLDNIMVFENYPVAETINSGKSSQTELTITDIKTFEQTHYGFNVVVVPGNDLTIKLSHNRLLYDEKFIINMENHFKGIIQAVIDNSNIRVQDIEILSASEKKQLLVDFNQTQAEYPKEKTVQELFEEQVSKGPDQIAVVFKDQQLTYRELNEKANQLAWVLRKKGVGQDTVVGLLVRPSLEMFIGVLGILKSGGAYLPIDHEYPQERIRYMLEASNSKLLLAQRDLMTGIDYPGEVLDLQSDGLYREKGENLSNLNRPGDLAYIIYTSGSTGKPKGVMIEHRSLINLCQWHMKDYQVTNLDKSTKYAGFGFDASVWEIFPYLLSGSTIHVIPEELRLDIGELNRYYEAHGITISFLPTQICEEFLKTGNRSLRKLLTGGDKLRQYVKTNFELVNNYGPTENTVVTTSFVTNQVYSNIPIGKPVSNSRIYILGENRQLQPVGVAGELCISGDGLARGYLNRAELTVEKFVANPYEPGERMYRTGDLARWLPDGNIEFLGRIDDQVKVRGYRIELGEIENELLKYGPVKEAVVVAREEENGGKYLCAYIVAEEEIKIHELREYLVKELPDYMVPSYYIPVERIPLTPNGKIDRKALPQPEGALYAAASYEAPGSHTEEILAGIWQEVLGVEKIGVHDNFFNLGGHSLKATVLASRIHKEMNVEIPLREIFQRATIRELAEYMDGAAENIYAAIQPVAEQADYPVSAAQKRLYVLNQLDAASTGYNIPAVMVIEGELNRERLAETFYQLLQRHEALRTSFQLKEGEPVQIIHQHTDFKVNYQEAASAEIKRIVAEFIKPFDLSQAPLFRVGLIRLSKMKHLLMLDIHHIIADGVSMNILTEEFIRLYEGKGLPKLGIQYKDYAVWQHQLFTGESIHARGRAKQEEYWLKAFDDEIPVLNLPTDYPRPTIQSFAGDRITFNTGRELAVGLKNLAAATGGTLYMVLLAAYNVLLSKYAGQEDIIVGSPSAGRPHADLEGIIGMFVNTLAMRNRPESGKTFKEFLLEVKANALSAYENQDYQFEELLEKLNLKRDISRNPLFDVMFALQNVGHSEAKLADVQLTPYQFENRIAKFDLTLEATETGEAIGFSLEYCTKLFRKETVQRMAGHFLNILREVTANPDIRLSEIDILSEAEIRQLMVEFNDTRTEYPKAQTLQALFEEQVARRPAQIAVVFEDQQLTYKELNAKANQLARLLRKKGVQEETIVGLMMERSPQMIVAIMAILKAGGAYLPIDPEYPKGRILSILEDAETKILLTHDSLLRRFNFTKDEMGMTPGREVILLDKMADDIAKETDGNLENVNHSTNLAYVMYTSGSTGKPKGNLIMHYNISRVVKDTNYINITAQDVMLQLSNYAFDGSTFDIFGSLLNGAKLVLMNKETLLDLPKLIELIRKEQITLFFITTALFNTLVDINVEGFRGIRKILFGGERVSVSHVRRALNYLGKGKLIHVYGPTESTVYATFHPIDEVDETSGTIPIGKPLANTKAYVVSLDNLLKPVGVPGELCIAGDGLARGYLKRPELTGEKFVPNPFVEGEIMYRTGDLVRWLPSGDIEFLGRIDQQIKLRGFRIELGEIESQLVKYTPIQEAVVSDRADLNGNKYLCAYVVSKEKLDLSDLRDHLAQELPDYMIPSYFVSLEKLPLTSNGKIDRKALPEPAGNLGTGVEYIAPANETEAKLALIWQDILGIAKVGTRDNFFELGGSSLKAMILVSRINSEFSMDMPLRVVLKLPTIQMLAEYLFNLERFTEKSQDDQPMVLLNMKQHQNIFAFPPIAGFAGTYGNLAKSISSHSFYSFDFIEEDERLVKYADWIYEVQKEGPYILFGYSGGGNIAFEVAKELKRRGGEVSDIIMLDSFRVYDEHALDQIEVKREEVEQQVLAYLSQYSPVGAGFQDQKTDFDSIVAKVYQKEFQYGQFMKKTVNSGMIAADIHIVKAESGKKQDQNTCWDKVTTGKVIIYQGAGSHGDMLTCPENTALVNKILENIAQKLPEEGVL